MDINTWWILLAVTGISFGAGTALGVFILFATQVRGLSKQGFFLRGGGRKEVFGYRGVLCIIL